MLKFLGKALAGAVLTKEGRQAIDKIATARTKPVPPPLPNMAIDQVRGSVGDGADKALEEALTPGKRASLIREAMRIQSSKQTVLNQLSDEDRQKLAQMAATAFKTGKRR